jgi:hypothetical protein
MRKQTGLILSAGFIAQLAAGGVGSAVGAPASAPEGCLAAPNAAAGAGKHWYYHLDRATRRKCWYIGPAGQAVHNVAPHAARQAQPPAKAQASSEVESVDQTAVEPVTDEQPAAQNGRTDQADDVWSRSAAPFDYRTQLQPAEAMQSKATPVPPQATPAQPPPQPVQPQATPVQPQAQSTRAKNDASMGLGATASASPANLAAQVSAGPEQQPEASAASTADSAQAETSTSMRTLLVIGGALAIIFGLLIATLKIVSAMRRQIHVSRDRQRSDGEMVNWSPPLQPDITHLPSLSAAGPQQADDLREMLEKLLRNLEGDPQARAARASNSAWAPPRPRPPLR